MRQFLPYMSVEELKELQIEYETRLADVQKTPAYPPIEYKPNHALARDLQIGLDKIKTAIHSRLSVAI